MHPGRHAAIRAIATIVVIVVTATSAWAYERQGGFEWGVKSQACSDEGGAEGFGYVEATAHIKEYGVSGTRSFSVRFTRQKLVEDAWVNTSKATKTSTKFPNDDANHTYEPRQRFSFSLIDTAPGQTVWFRIRMRFSWLGRDGELLRSRSAVGDACPLTATFPGAT